MIAIDLFPSYVPKTSISSELVSVDLGCLFKQPVDSRHYFQRRSAITNDENVTSKELSFTRDSISSVTACEEYSHTSPYLATLRLLFDSTAYYPTFPFNSPYLNIFLNKPYAIDAKICSFHESG